MAHILVVDDDADVREVFRETLVWAGHTAAVVSDIRTARKLLNLKRPDLVILDLHFPGNEDALAFAAELRQSHKEVPIVACSGNPDLAYGAQLAEGLFTSVFTKPCDVLVILRAVPNLL